MMARQSGQLSAIADLPDFEGIVIAAADQGLAIGAEGEAVDRAVVAQEGAQVFPRGQTPQLNGFIIAAAGQYIPLGADRHGLDPGKPFRMAGERAQ